MLGRRKAKETPEQAEAPAVESGSGETPKPKKRFPLKAVLLVVGILAVLAVVVFVVIPKFNGGGETEVVATTTPTTSAATVEDKAPKLVASSTEGISKTTTKEIVSMLQWANVIYVGAKPHHRKVTLKGVEGLHLGPISRGQDIAMAQLIGIGSTVVVDASEDSDPGRALSNAYVYGPNSKASINALVILAGWGQSDGTSPLLSEMQDVAEANKRGVNRDWGDKLPTASEVGSDIIWARSLLGRHPWASKPDAKLLGVELAAKVAKRQAEQESA